ncbi:MAG: LysR substrate-binding domain-containing protein, partial [Pseudomonadota bacterium]
MNIRDMEYIVAVSETGHFSKAADICAVSQPTLSAQIKKMEDYLGVLIFHRNKIHGQVQTTTYGKKIIQHAKQILHEKDQIKKIAQQSKDPFAGVLKIGAFPTLAPYYLPHILPDLKKQLPKMQFYVIEEKTLTLLKMLKEKHLDIAFLALPIENQALETHPIFFDPFYFAVHKAHPLAKLSEIEVEDILDEKLLLLEDGHCLTSQALDFCNHFGTANIDDFRASSPQMLLEMIRLGTGASLMPRSIVQKTTYDDIIFIPFKD